MLILQPAPLRFAGGEYLGFHQLKQTNGLSQKDERIDQPLLKMETIMKNYRLNAIAGLLSLLVAGHAFAEDASTNGIPTAILQRYTGSTAVVVDSSTNGIPAAILEPYSDFFCLAQANMVKKDQIESSELTTGSITAVKDGAVMPSCK
jgi:hypothetical protein